MMIECQTEHGRPRAIQTDVSHPQYGWVFYATEDGRWVTLRKAMPNELEEAESIRRSRSRIGPLGDSIMTRA